jgi:hypothetical protein
MTSPIAYTNATGGPQITVDTLINDPTMIPALVMSLANQAFLADVLFRGFDGVQGGAVLYEESTPLYGDAGTDGDIVYEEWSEIPAAVGILGKPRVARVKPRALAVKISERMRRWNQMDKVNNQITQVVNTFVDKIDRAAMSLLLRNNAIPTFAASVVWTDYANAVPLNDILIGKKTVRTQKDAQGNEFGFIPDTIVLNDGAETDLLLNKAIQTLYRGSSAPDNPVFKGQWDTNMLKLNWLFSPRMDADKALLLQSKKVGFVGDDIPFNSTELYQERRETETWRSDTKRWSAMGVDQPLAACVITGISD